MNIEASKEELIATILGSKIYGDEETFSATYRADIDCIILLSDSGMEERYYFNNFILEVLQGGFSLEN